MRVARWLPLLACLIATNMSASVIQYLTTDVNLNLNLFRYDYLLSGMTVQTNQQIDIRFDPARYGTLSNVHVPSGFSSLVLQPNNPPGVFGDLILFPSTNNLLLSGQQLSIDVVSLDNGAITSQPYFIDQYDANGNFLFTVSAGFTTAEVTAPSVPEPALFLLVGIALLAGGWWRMRKRTLRASAA
jgi:hypothetical protein